MNTKHVYFVRHGESVANATGIRQGPETPLTELGKKQAICVAGRLSALPIERVVISTYTRAKETAAPIIEAGRHTAVNYSELFIERRNPSLMVGTKMNDPALEHVWSKIAANHHLPHWHHSDEENFADLVSRAKKALIFLEELNEKHILIVSHGMFMKVVFAHVLLGEKLDGRIFWDQFIPAKNVVNTGIMHIEHTENYRKTRKFWKLISWNDYTHLPSDLF